MTALAFDTLAYVKRLRESGVENSLAEALACAIQDSVPAKADLTRIESRLGQLDASLRAEIKDGQVNLIKWLVPLLLGQTAAIVALVELF